MKVDWLIDLQVTKIKKGKKAKKKKVNDSFCTINIKIS